MPSDVTEADVQDLADHLSTYLQRAKAGETIIVIREGEPFCRLGPVPKAN